MILIDNSILLPFYAGFSSCVFLIDTLIIQSQSSAVALPLAACTSCYRALRTSPRVGHSLPFPAERHGSVRSVNTATAAN